MPTKKRRKIKLPTLQQLHAALPVVSAGLSILSSLPLKNKKVNKTLSVAAAATGGLGAMYMANPASSTLDLRPPLTLPPSVTKQHLQKALHDLKTAPPETPPEEVASMTAKILVLAQLLLEEK